MTLEEKLKKFKSGTVALHTPTKEIWDRLTKKLEDRGYTWCSGRAAWEHYKGMTCISNHADGMAHCSRDYYRSEGFRILEITEEDFTDSSETVESVLESIEEVKADLKLYDELFKKYGVVMAENLEPTMRAKLESLLKKRVVS